MSKRIHILCDGGLGNRIAGLVSGLITADRLEMPAVVCWPSNNWCGAGFDDLFDMPTVQHNGHGINDIIVPGSDAVFMLHENQTGVELRTELGHGRRSELVARASGRDVVFYTARVPEHIESQDVLAKIKHIKPAADVQRTVDEFCKLNLIDSTTVGLHLRKTDQYNLDEDWWYDYVQRKGAGKRYFVCSDDRETESRFAALKNVVTFAKTHYVEKLIEGPWRQDAVRDAEGRVFPNNINRTRDSVIQAWVDLLIMSRTYILPTVKSSFSQVAHWIRASQAA
jgi:hypothetical protein